MAGTIGYKFKPADPEGASLNAATTGTGRAIPMQECRQIIWTVEGNGTISGGNVIIETADSQSYAGTWYELDSVAPTSGAAYTNTYPAASSGFVRARVSSNITGGGSVTVRINGLIA
jgi:hypothetical protein